jgi:hypothetical protein
MSFLGYNINYIIHDLLEQIQQLYELTLNNDDLSEPRLILSLMYQIQSNNKGCYVSKCYLSKFHKYPRFTC